MESEGKPSGDRLSELTAKRLSLAPEVAWYKFREGLPVYDRKRESESLARLVNQGKTMGLPSGRVKTFFTAQMAASRSVQKKLITEWKMGGQLPTAPPRDLVKGIRPEMDRLNSEILIELARTLRRGN